MSSANQSDNEQTREKIRKRFKGGNMDNAEHIPAKEIPKLFDADNDMKVAVYARVSTLSTQQTSSQVIQEEYYADFVSRQDGWELAGIYADEGISGTSLNHRDEFKRMIEDCKKGGIDLIVVKSVSRFTRNVNDGRASIDMLAELNPPVGVWFENERIYSLSSDSEFLLNLSMSVAAEESRVKSVSMNSSLKMRFSHAILMTPPLLGYNNDDDGNLVINEDEAETVRLIFSMYQYGYTCDIIAETLATLGRKTKLGNTKWSPHSILGVLKNERHCGQVKTWKTYTPNYKTHKSKKNHGNREQYIYRNHHTPIISTDDYIVVQKMIANAKYGGRSFMPELRVNSGGALHGFVSINPRWGAFKKEDYIFASESVGEGVQNESLFNVRCGEIDLRGYEIARAQFFRSTEITSGSFYSRNAWFSGECIRKLGNAEYIELLVHPTEKLLTVRECSPEHRNAIKWAKVIEDKAYTRHFGGTAYLGTLFDIFDWNPAWGYRLRGSIKNVGREPVAFFDAQETEVLIPHVSTPETTAVSEHLANGKLDDYYVAARSKYRLIVIPNAWLNSFGISYYQQAAKNAKIDRAGIGAEAEHNTEPDIQPTPREELADNIKRIHAKYENTEVHNGLSTNNTV